MDLKALGNSPVGELVTLEGQDARFGPFSYMAFLPTPLPADVDLQSRSWMAVTNASIALGKLDQACVQLPDPRLLIRPALWREALDTSALEGTYGALQDLLEAQLPSAQFLSPETREIRAYERAALQAFDAIHERPISVGFLSELQGELMKGAQFPPRHIGELRQDPVWIGPRDRPIQDSRFVPPPPGDQLRLGVEQWERWVQKEHEDLPPVLRAALAHYQFETLHPFGDGNGRVGRLVVVLQLLTGNAIQQPAVTLSPWFLRRRQQYQDHLLQVSVTGDWNPWIQFFSDAVREQCQSLISVADALVAWLNDSRREVHQRRWSGAIHNLLEDLIEWPVTTVGDTAQRYSVSTVNATRMIDHLVEIGVLEELTGKTYGRVFGARYVMNQVDQI